MWFLFSKFKLKNWKKYTPERRFVILQALEKKVAKKLEIEPLKLEINYKENWNCFGAYTTFGKEKKIVINVNLIEEQRFRFHAMETIAHETRHAYQHSVVSKKLKWYQFRARSWQRNWGSYFNSGVDDVMYNNQAVERDAQKYSIKFLKKHKYPKEEDYVNTLEAVLYRYNQAELNAIKEYGMFYKFKIEKNIKNKKPD